MNGFQFIGGIVRWLLKGGKTELKDEITGIDNIILGLLPGLFYFV